MRQNKRLVNLVVVNSMIYCDNLPYEVKEHLLLSFVRR